MKDLVISGLASIYITISDVNILPILKPPLRIEEVIKQFNTLKNNIEVVNLSAAEFDQMLISDKDTKDSNEIR